MPLPTTVLPRTQPAVNQPMWRGSADASGAAGSLGTTSS
jgi:hypothetical protein